MDTPMISIGNRSLCHYLLSIYSLFLQGVDQVLLKSRGSFNGKNADIANLINEDLMPYTFELDFKNSVEKVQSVGSSYKASVLTSILRLQKAKLPDLTKTRIPVRARSGDNICELDVCELELLLNLLSKNGIQKLALSTVGKDEGDESIELGEIDLKNYSLIICDHFLQTPIITDKGSKVLFDYRSSLANALIRSGLLTPDLERYTSIVSQWDDVIFGLDTNLFYTGMITASLLNMLLKIPSGNFIDSPDWATLVLSKVAMGEIENRATRSNDHRARREALRAIQEIMLINRSKDLEGVSMFLTGTIPPEISFSSGETNSIRDSIIREHFRNFLKNLDFYKGSYFLTQDFNNATLAEAEGLVTLYIKKPLPVKKDYTLLGMDTITASEVIYESSVEFLPLVLEADGIKLNVLSDWSGKTLEDWEDWKVRIEWCNDAPGIRSKLEYWINDETLSTMISGWRNLRERYVSWVR